MRYVHFMYQGQATLGVRTEAGVRVLGHEPLEALLKRGVDLSTYGAEAAGLHDLGFEEDWLVVDLQPNPGVTLDVPDIGQWCNPARPTTMVPGGPGYRRWEFMRLPHESLEDLQDTAKVWELLAPWVNPGTATLVRHAVYQFRSRIAEKWRNGRVLLAGDAAHLMPPFMGQGMCSGIRDAWNLSWRLDLVLRGACDERLLDSYTPERKPQIRAVIDASVAMGKVVCVSDPQAADERDRAFLAGEVPPLAPFPGLTGGLIHKAADGSPLGLAGSLGVHGSIEVDGVVARYDELFGRGFHLVVIGDRDPLALINREQRDALAALGLRVIRLAPQGQGGYVDHSGKYHRFMQENGVTAMLVRPDFYLFGAVAQVAEVPALLADLLAQLHLGVRTPEAAL